MNFKEMLLWLDPDGNGFWNYKWDWKVLAIIGGAAVLLSFNIQAMLDFCRIIDWADIYIHETGHKIMALIGSEFLHVAGGTMFEFGVPVCVYLYALRTRQQLMSIFCLLWSSIALFHIGIYMADSRAKALLYITEDFEIDTTGAHHDWAYMLGKFGLLRYDTLLGGAVKFTGCLLAGVALASCLLHFLKNREKKTENPLLS